MQNKFLIDFFVKVAKLFGNTFIKDDSGEMKLQKTVDKIDVFTSYTQIIKEQIQANEKVMELLVRKFSTDENTIDFWNMRREYLKLKREKLDLQVEHYAKQDFVQHYQNRIKFYEEYNKELTKKTQSELPKLIQELERIVPTLIDGKEKVLSVGYLNRYYTQKHTQQTLNTLFTEIEDWVLKLKQ